ncbi:FKBP-type peptidyl-prolyl cis-trans isomerase [Flavivirga spongiicola]|uniref:Peptidyl-prolyl cis-trans isomerase n=1 Tax=Flavivirga spongiicola TaxID=421621 RepID=A0ABU7XLJ3_9FLAO|nr:FKBP-type peptidyl-prolyl cis-trans isomerase [Flavivirga sp. MEBiC05379]MDO5981280.1 FKBP-type peptidyl-prolyl cis-trans isomerase [Flavivirga sp. MEBiC05379]
MKYIMFSLVLSLFVSCSSDDEKDYVALNDKEITDYIAKNNLAAEKSATGLYYVIDDEGTGEQPNSTSNVTVAYKGYFTNGTVFDQSDGEGISFGLQQVIAGWTEGITYFKEGGSGKLLIPSHLAYGNSGRGSIPGGAVLIFDINLISVN